MNDPKKDLKTVMANDWHLKFMSTPYFMGVHSFSKSNECQFSLNIVRKYILLERQWL